jgi:hypothetical protein
MKYTVMMLSIGLAVAAMAVLGVGLASAQATSGASPFLLLPAVGHSAGVDGPSGPFVLVRGGRMRMGGHAGMGGHRSFHRRAFFFGAAGYPYYSTYTPEYNPDPSTTCVWNGYKYKCYKFLDEPTL